MRFEVLKNGQPVCLCGIEGNGVLTVDVKYVKVKRDDGFAQLSAGAIGKYDRAMETDQYVAWPVPTVAVGDEITIRLLPAGDFDSPPQADRISKKTIDDPCWGTMQYFIHAWSVDIPFEFPPFESAHLKLEAGVKGPTLRQRQMLEQFQVRHHKLWPQIAKALVNCHPKIDSIVQLERRIKSQISIRIDRHRQDDLQLKYTLIREPKSLAYLVTLRNWKIVEVMMTE